MTKSQITHSTTIHVLKPCYLLVLGKESRFGRSNFQQRRGQEPSSACSPLSSHLPPAPTPKGSNCIFTLFLYQFMDSHQTANSNYYDEGFEIGYSSQI